MTWIANRPKLALFASQASAFVVAFVATAHAAANETPARSSPSGSGARGGESTPGFDVTGSHPLPNANDRDAPGRGACGCSLADGGRTPPGATLSFSALVAVFAARRRRACHT